MRFLVTAGPTREFIDPARFISNPSSGKMGFALAEAALKKGQEVKLITGPTTLIEPEGVKCFRVISASDMYKEVMRELQWAEVVIMSAAVCDYRPSKIETKKIKKTKSPLKITLLSTKDILDEIGKKKERKYVVGFAAETDNLIENAREKMINKKLDMIIANRIGSENSGFETDMNNVAILLPTGVVEEIEGKSKKQIGEIIIERILENIGKDA